jgi:hypothetical protein
MYRNHFTHLLTGRSAGIYGRLDCADIAGHHNRYQAAFDFLATQKLDFGRFDHCIRRFDCSD